MGSTSRRSGATGASSTVGRPTPRGQSAAIDASLTPGALYGALLPWEPIQDYDLTMGCKVAGMSVWKTWHKAQLGRTLEGWLAQHKIEVVFDLLSNDYARALEPALTAIDWRRVHYSGGIGSLSWRGDDVSAFLARQSPKRWP